MPLLKLKERALAGRLLLGPCGRWLEANEVPYGRGGGVTGRWGFRCWGCVGVSLL